MYSDTVVILAAGKGERMGGDIPKVMLEVAGKPILKHVIEFWERYKVKNFIFVLGHQYEYIRNYLIHVDLDHWTFVIQKEQKGIANAISLTENVVPDRFIVALGDCLNIGDFKYPVDMVQGYGILDNEYKNNQARGCSVIVVNNHITSVFEKPPMDYAGIGTYFFDRMVFNYIRNTKPSSVRNEIDIADVMTNMVRDSHVIEAVPFRGYFINCTYPEDIERADKLLNVRNLVINNIKGRLENGIKFE
jgi:NDP-sugar pyrophosphorylase family protein